MIDALPFSQIWCVDFEFANQPGERPDPVCIVAWELRSGRKLRLWCDKLQGRRLPPYPIGPDSLFVAYTASAEFNCHLALGWPLPERVLDLYAEFRALTCGKAVTCGYGLTGALAWHGLPAMAAEEKKAMQEMIAAGGPWTDQQQREILEYCQQDVEALARLLPAMLPRIDLPRALLRGRYMCAVARMEHNGIPIDTVTLGQLRTHWSALQDGLIAEVDRGFGVFEGHTFKTNKFSAYLERADIPWPRLPSGQLALDKKTFKDMAQLFPALEPMRQLRKTLSQMRLHDLAVGSDGRNRTMLGAFGAKSSRNTPSNAKSVLGSAAWLRGLIRPEPGRAVAYIDWSQQEVAIAAALSKDESMMAAYASGDPYLALAQQAKAVPPDATKSSHGRERELFKTCMLAVQYGQGAGGMAERIGKPLIVARGLLKDHRRTYRRFWEWSDAAVDQFMLHNRLWSVFNWQLFPGPKVTSRTARNFPMQANGAEMMRMAACLMSEAGINVCAPAHDAFLVEAAEEDIHDVVALARSLMEQASMIVLSGFPLRTDVAVYRYPDRYTDPRGEGMWNTIMELLKPMCVDAPTKCRNAPAMCINSTPVPLISNVYSSNVFINI